MFISLTECNSDTTEKLPLGVDVTPHPTTPAHMLADTLLDAITVGCYIF
jgi:hypothetical protein